MPSPSVPRPARNLEQQHKLAKDLLASAQEGDAAATARIRAHRHGAASEASPQLADAQLTVARDAGFESWPRLVAEFHERDVRAFCAAMRAGDVGAVERALADEHVRKRVNDPLFDFGQRALHVAAKHGALLRVLLHAGADVNLKSEWQNGPYTVLDHADADTARFLIGEGATLTPNVAARLGWFDELRALITADATLVHARGGDGQQPLHEARTVEIAEFLLAHGAGIDVRCTDHASTPAQYALAERPDVCRFLLSRGATPDIFMAARLGDLALATRLLEATPDCVAARINAPGYAPVPPFNIYCWSLGFGLTPHEVARRNEHPDVLAVLVEHSPARVRLLDALWLADAPAVESLVAADPGLVGALAPRDQAQLAQAIFHGEYAAAELMLRIGFDPAAPGVDGGSALHAACWVGNVRLVQLLLAHGGVPLDARDPTHGSTLLGWAAFGSVHRRASGADYPAVAALLVAAGADIASAGNRANRTLLQMAEGEPAMQDALRRLGAA